VASAYAAVCAGGTVHVAAGTYSAELILSDATVKDGITVDGAGAATILDGGVKTTHSVAVNGMTLSNMTIRHTDGTAGEGLLRMDNGGFITDMTLSGVVFDGQGIAGVHGILGQGLIGTVTVTGCTLENIANWAVLDSDSGGGAGDVGLTAFVFTNNTVRNNDGGIALRGCQVVGSLTSSATITGNAFSNMNENWAPCAYPTNQCGWAGIEANHIDTVTLDNNTVDNMNVNSWGEGQAFQIWKVNTLNMTGNTITNCYEGVRIYANVAGRPIPAGSVTGNSFSGNGYAIEVFGNADGDAPLNASCNYYGNDNGPLYVGQNDHTANGETYGDEVKGDVSYALWRVGSVAGACTGGDCDSNTIHDYADIVVGALDCDGDQKHDECEIKADAAIAIEDYDNHDDNDIDDEYNHN